MKKIIILFVWSLVTIVLTFSSCDSMNDIHQKYLDLGEQIYPCKADSLSSFPGYGRVKLVWYVNADPKVEQTVIYWNERQDSIVKPFVRTVEGVQKDSAIVEGLAQGDYIFELINKNQFGERSLTTMVQGKSYGETYASGLRSRSFMDLSIAGFDPATQSSTVKITWDEVPEGCLGVTVRYKKRSTGEEVTLEVDNATTETIVTDVGNRLEHPDDLLYFSSMYKPDRCIDLIGSLDQKAQIALYMASGTRVENTLYDGSNTTITHTYSRQDKILRMVSNASGSRTFTCNRVAELSPTTIGTSMRLTVRENQTVGVEGIYASLNPVTDAETGNSAFDPATQTFNLRYRVKTNGGSYAVTETLVPKTTPYEKATAKPFGDMRSVIPGDNNTELLPYSFASLSDGVTWAINGWLTQNIDGGSTSFTVDLHEKIKLTRIIHWHAAWSRAEAYGNANILQFEAWGVAELDASKLGNAAYWADAANPAGTFKEDWQYLGLHTIERLDKKDATEQEIIERMQYGDQFFVPESATPVRYVRIYVRDGTWAANLSYFFIGEMSFFGYPQ